MVCWCIGSLWGKSFVLVLSSWKFLDLAISWMSWACVYMCSVATSNSFIWLPGRSYVGGCFSSPIATCFWYIKTSSFSFLSFGTWLCVYLTVVQREIFWCGKHVMGVAGGGHSHSPDHNESHDHDHSYSDLPSHSHSLQDLSVGLSVLGEYPSTCSCAYWT